MTEKKGPADCLFEVAWEVCNRVGGIYIVVKSKIPSLKSRYPVYYTIGPYFPKSHLSEFQELPPPRELKDVFDRLRAEDIFCHYGKWLVKGEPNTILVDFSVLMEQKDNIKTELWLDYKIDSLGSGYDFDEPITWGRAVGRLLSELSNTMRDKRVIAHFHEWLTGAALLYLKKQKSSIATVFTTHATMLGRTITGNGVNLYANLGSFDPEKEAYKYGIQAKFMTERACAQNADVFTTVSEITGIESAHFLGKKPDLILPNGLDIDVFPTFEEISVKHILYRRRMREFIMAYFFPYYTFDIENTLIYFISGRYEFHDKGVDVMIDALGRLNSLLKAGGSDKTIIAFFWIPGNIKGIRPELLEGETFFDDIKGYVDESIYDIKERILYMVLNREEGAGRFKLPPDFILEVKKKVLRLIRNGNPPLSTHELYDEEKDAIIRRFGETGLDNQPDDRVKVVFYPTYLNGADRLLDLEYYSAILGAHLGVFPSYYEPWGYTPVECAALGVASVTTDLAGFGRFITKALPNYAGRKNPGIFVLRRLNVSYDDSVAELTRIMHYFSQLTKEERIENKIEAKRLVSLVGWDSMIRYYIDAHSIAIQKKQTG
ncbi:hypothetical protein COT48_00950 [Candidatus Woesearchaeota archaeon CG08_land_8_20_14_0_20_47_9]|nr:MAG: hypothetical protein AUJ69_00705 [Candidatus Woesearchaeota archaeon CG1_02_47_18]PIN74067.1 MAG: hypothetical protein COV22_01265 [Candidatus Woesearchaeota archaeon CG10_big_fil_rev_8_21_14_0_10_47_5]PIO04335.1 MAG: hypothetical protein COT48_00950 [Candidatus Woesearchaeota archaeon CG08_land_8_20_14_0_20_47_9]HII29608.1 hypothetical protein [Candidatus Woesearchaeota archaeon]